MTAETPAMTAEIPASLPPVDAPTAEHTEIHCDRCGHRVRANRAALCAARGHSVSVVEIKVTTFNAPHARSFYAEPAPYLGSAR